MLALVVGLLTPECFGLACTGLSSPLPVPAGRLLVLGTGWRPYLLRCLFRRPFPRFRSISGDAFATCTPLISFGFPSRLPCRVSICASALPPCFGSRSGHGLQPFLAGSSSPPEYATSFVPSSRRALCAAALTALLLTRTDPGAACSASVPLPGLLPAGFVGLTKRSHQSSPESSPCQKFFMQHAKNSTGFKSPVKLLRCTRRKPGRQGVDRPPPNTLTNTLYTPSIHPLWRPPGRLAGPANSSDKAPWQST